MSVMEFAEHSTTIGPYTLDLEIRTESDGEKYTNCSVEQKVQGQVYGTTLDHVDLYDCFRTEDEDIEISPRHKEAMFKWAWANGY